MNRFDNESRRTAEARNGNGGELGAAARELSKIAVEETKRTTGLSQRAAYRKRLFEMRRRLNGEYRRNYALAAGSVFCGAVGEVLVNLIGIPTVIDAVTIVSDAVNASRENTAKLMSPKLNGMFVTPKDIDETVKRLAGLLSEGINMAFSNDEYDDYSE